MPILVLPKLFPPYYLRLTVITSIELGILFSAGDPEVQRGKLTCLKSELGWWWQERDLNLGLTPGRCFWPRGHDKCVFPLPSLVSCLVSQLWWTGHKEVEEPLVLKISDPKEFNVPPLTEHEGGNKLCPNDKIQWKSWLSPLSETDWPYPASLWVV